jgi:hypothetical protein
MLLRTDARESLKVTSVGLKLLERQDNKDKLLACCYRLAQEGLPSLLPYITRQRFRPSLEEFLTLVQDRSMSLPDDAKVHMTRTKGEGGGGAAEAQAAAADEVLADAAAKAGAEPATAQEVPGDEEAAAAPAAEAPKKPSGFPRPRCAFSDASTVEQLADIDYGCCVALLRPHDAAALGLASEDSATGGLAANAPLAISCWRGRGCVNTLVSKQECAQMAERIQTAIAARDKAAAAAAGDAAAV